MKLMKSFARICEAENRVSLPEVNRLVKFETYEEFHGARVYPPYVTMTKIGLLFILGFVPGDLFYHGLTRAFFVIAGLRILATFFSGLIIMTTTNPRFRGCRVRAALILGAISLFFLVSGYILYDPRIYFVSFSWVYYQIATLMLSPLLSVRFYLSIHVPAVIAVTLAMSAAGVRDDDIGIFVLFTLPAMVYLSIMLKVFARKAEETYRLAYQNHLHMMLDSLSRLLNRRT